MKKIKWLYCLVLILIVINLIQYYSYFYYRSLPSDAVPNEAIAKQISDVVQVSILNVNPSELMPSIVNYDDKRKVWNVIINVPDVGFGSDCKIVIRKKDGKIMEVRLLN